MQIRAGARLQSVTGETQVVVVKAPPGDVDLRCGGHPMVPLGEASSAAQPDVGFDEATQVGKRYADESVGIEVLCTKGGQGSLSVGSTVLPIKDAKPLPSSD